MSTETKTEATPNVAQQGIQQAEAGKPADAGAAPAADAGATQAVTPKVDAAFADEDAKLAEAEAAVAAEAKAKAAGGGEQAAAAPADAGAAAAAPAAGAIQKAADTVKSAETAAIIALRRQNSELKASNLVLTGQVQALSGVVRPQQHAAAAGDAGGQGAEGEGQTYAQALETIDQQLLEIAGKVDKGELTMAQYQQKERELRKQEREVLDQRSEELLAAAGANAGPTNDLGLQEHTTKLVTDFPFLNELSRAQLEPYEALAYHAAEREGKPIPQGPMGSKILRERMAELAERDYAPEAHAKRVAAKAAAAGGNGQGQGTQGQSGGPTGAKPGQAQQPTAAQREAKLAAAGNMPPDIGKIGAGAPAGELTEAQGAAALAALHDEDSAIRWLDQHPQFVQKVAGKSFRLPGGK